MTRRRARLVLEDGSCFEGVGCGADGVTSGEVVFNTSMTGYQEVLTDPSYAGQIVTMTCPEIGNYGTTPLDAESRRPLVAGFIVRECSPVASNWRSTAALATIFGRTTSSRIAGIDTRALTRRLRSGGVLRGAIGTGESAHRGAGRTRAPDSADGRAGPGARSDVRRAVRLRRARRRVGAGEAGIVTDREFVPAGSAIAAGGRTTPPAARRCLRLRHEVEHPPPPERARLRRARLPGDDAGPRGAGAPARRRLPQQRPRRSGAADLCVRQRARAGRRGHADVRHLPRPPDARRWRSAARPSS